jgi:DNA sulfur modification protein DndB
MLANIGKIEDLRSLARSKARNFETKSVHPKLVDEYVSYGWTIDKEHSTSVRLRKGKQHGTYLEDRVWSLFYKMGFTHLSGNGGGKLYISPKENNSPKNQIDVVAIDDEVAIAIECKSADQYSRRPQFQDELGKFSLIRERFINTINSQYPGRKRQVVLAMFTSKIALSDKSDKERAREAKIMLFDNTDLEYYECLVHHLGPAAKYQLLSDMLPGKTIPGLEIKVPAIRTKMGGAYCYTFSISPEYLLKIAYVSHRSKGKASDINTYQRMLNRKRLSDIAEYIQEDGIFPTNIVINIEKNRLNFHRIQQDADPKRNPDSGLLGWLDIRPTYKSAWIIDGQHRLFAYSGHERAAQSLVSVLAFEGLLPSTQAELFVDINSRQKRVPPSLLQELYAEMHWDSENPEERVRAIISKAIQELEADPESPFFKKILKADADADDLCCITLSSIFGAVNKADFYISGKKHGSIIEYGPLWAGDNEATLKRTVYILRNWFNTIRLKAQDWWDKGKGSGGGLAMNDGIICCINVLRSVFQHLDTTNHKLIHLDNEDLFNLTKKYAEILGDYYASLSEEERKRFRDLRAIQGQTTRTRRCQKAIHDRIPSFSPQGLDKFLQEEKSETNKKGKEIIDYIEITLQKLIIEELMREYGTQETEWWILGIPKTVRTKAAKLFEDDDARRGGKEHYFDLIDYRDIAVKNWSMFESLLAYGKAGNKDKRTSWMNFINEKRKIVAHSTSGVTLSIDDLNQLEEYKNWLDNRIIGSKEDSSIIQ